MQNKKIYIFLLSSVCFFVITLQASGYTGKQPKVEAVLEKVNQARTIAGVQPLAINEQLNKAATVKAKDMVSRGYFSHLSPDGLRPWDFVGQANYSFITAGENLAINYTDAGTLVQAWLASDTHRTNILSPLFTQTGIAVATATTETGAQTIIVQFFARPE